MTVIWPVIKLILINTLIPIQSNLNLKIIQLLQAKPILKIKIKILTQQIIKLKI